MLFNVRLVSDHLFRGDLKEKSKMSTLHYSTRLYGERKTESQQTLAYRAGVYC